MSLCQKVFAGLLWMLLIGLVTGPTLIAQNSFTDNFDAPTLDPAWLLHPGTIRACSHY